MASVTYQAEFRDSATQFCVDGRNPAGAYRRISKQVGVHPEALRTWVHDAEKDEGLRPGPTSTEARIKELEQEVRELRRANTTLKQHRAIRYPDRLAEGDAVASVGSKATRMTP